MAKQTQGQGRPETAAVSAPSGVPTTPEPPVRRWPHPIQGQESEQTAEPALHFIRCALSYQNQLLADIKTLLEELLEELAEREEPREDTDPAEEEP